MNILVVDDSKLVRYKLREVIGKYAQQHEWANCTVMEAVDGIDALRMVETEHIDIMFLDWNMPNLSGDYVVDNVRSHKEYKKLRIVMTTTEGSKASVMKMIKKGVNGYVLKPFKDEKIYQALDALRVNTSK